MKDFFLACLSIISSVLIVLILVSGGWFIVWKLFLSRFRFVRELLGGMSESSTVLDLKNSRNKIKRVRRD
uniref:Putative conserved protein with signal anchor n=1 Tax=Xenopsylla cheopis TaxID=163159 RepID=A0A6M2DJA6_XENCH